MRQEVKAKAYQHNAAIRLITLMEIDYGDGTLYLCDTREGVTHNGQGYDPFPFRLELSEQTQDHPPDARIVIDNTDRRVLEALLGIDEADEELIATVRVVTNLDTDEVELGPIEFRLRGLRYDRSQIEGGLRYEDRLYDETPIIRFTNQNAPGLYP